MFKLRKGTKSYEDVLYTCTIRFLDDSEPIIVTFQVGVTKNCKNLMFTMLLIGKKIECFIFNLLKVT